MEKSIEEHLWSYWWLIFGKGYYFTDEFLDKCKRNSNITQSIQSDTNFYWGRIILTGFNDLKFNDEDQGHEVRFIQIKRKEQQFAQ